MAIGHIGAWGTPDFNITEGIGWLLGSPKTDQGGSEISISGWGLPNASTIQNPQSDAMRNLAGQVKGASTQNQSIQNMSIDPNAGKQQQQSGGGGGGDTGGNTGGGGNQFRPEDMNKTWFTNEFGQKQLIGNNGGGDINSMISELYDPALRLANEQEQTVRGGYEADRGNLLNRVAQSLGQYQEQNANLLQDTDLEQSRFNKTLESALAQAIRAYNGLSQRGNVLYGGASSAGRAMGELASREYFRQQGNVQAKQAEGNADFAIERGRIKQYTDSKIKDLDLYKNEALTALEQNLKNQLDTIAARRYDIEANRTRDKMAALQDTINQTRAVQQQDQQFRQNLAMAAINQMQEISGRAFTPAEIKAYLSEFASDLSVAPGAGSGASALSQLNAKPKTYEDEFTKLNPTAAKQTTTQPKLNTSSYIAQSLPQAGGYSPYFG